MFLVGSCLACTSSVRSISCPKRIRGFPHAAWYSLTLLIYFVRSWDMAYVDVSITMKTWLCFPLYWHSCFPRSFGVFAGHCCVATGKAQIQNKRNLVHLQSANNSRIPNLIVQQRSLWFKNRTWLQQEFCLHITFESLHRQKLQNSTASLNQKSKKTRPQEVTSPWFVLEAST